MECGIIELGLLMVFFKDGERKLCILYMDIIGYGNLRFYFVMGGICDFGNFYENDVILYVKIEGRKEYIVLDIFFYFLYKVLFLVFVVINFEFQIFVIKFCFR